MRHAKFQMDTIMNCYKVTNEDDCDDRIKSVIILASTKKIAEKKAISAFGYMYDKDRHNQQVNDIIKNVVALRRDVEDGEVLYMSEECL